MDGTDRRDPVVGRRVTPPPPEDRVVDRPRIDDLLGRLLAERHVVNVVATAGSGKTTAVAGFVLRRGAPVAWLTLDAAVAAPGRLLTYLAAAVDRHCPDVRDVVADATARGLPHPEVAGLLADGIGAVDLLIVIDETERLGEAPEPWAVLDALVRNASDGVRFLFLGRTNLPLGFLPQPGRFAVVTGADLAFTAAEASAALADRGGVGVDPERAVQETGGWVTGVLFEIWRFDDHVAGMGGEADPLFGYLSSNILAGLAPDLREFLVTTSLLAEVTADEARSLGVTDAEQPLAGIAAAHLPGTWTGSRRAFRAHPRFREYLLELLDRRGREAVSELRQRHGASLARQGHREEATEEFLRAGALAEAGRTAAPTILDVVERGDLAVAQRWIDELGGTVDREVPFAAARLMLALASFDLREAVRLADSLHEQGQREAVVRASDRAMALMVWAYLHQGRLDDVEAVLAVAGDGPAVLAARHCARSVLADGGSWPVEPPSPSGGPLDALLVIADYSLGRLSQVTDASVGGWADVLARPWLVAGMRAAGRTSEALELYEEATSSDTDPVFEIFVGPELLMDAGLHERARAALESGRRRAIRSGSIAMVGLNSVAAIRFALRVDRDPVRARGLLQRFESESGRRFGYMAEFLDASWGHVHLLTGKDDEALEVLRRAVASMVRSNRILELPAAAVLLAEAEWRAGEEAAADAAAELALDAAGRQGSNHLLLQALADLPEVLSRQLDAQPGPDSSWHNLGRALRSQRPTGSSTTVGSIHLHDFGPRRLLVDGVEMHPRIAKAYELLAYVLAGGRREFPRAELVDVLFDGREDRSTRAYVSQAIHQLRAVLPDGVVALHAGVLVVAPEVALSSDSVQFETLVAESARLQPAAMLTSVDAALGLSAQGPFLPGRRAAWADTRDQHLQGLAGGASAAAAEAAYALGRYSDAGRFVGVALRIDPCREDTTRLGMRLADAQGDGAEVLNLYRRCHHHLAEIGAEPSRATRELLENLRR